MQEVKVGKHRIELYSDIEELESGRYSKFNKYFLIDAHIGSSIEDVDKRFGNLYLMAKNEELEGLKNEINNLRQAIYFVLTEIDTTMMAFITLIHSIDGKPYTDLSDEGMKKTSELLQGLKVKTVRSTTQDIKKKSRMN